MAVFKRKFSKPTAFDLQIAIFQQHPGILHHQRLDVPELFVSILEVQWLEMNQLRLFVWLVFSMMSTL